MPVKTALKSRVLDKKDAQILEILQENGRESLTKIAKSVHLSIDSVHKRIKEMLKKGLFEFGIFIHPRAVGYGINADIRIKLQNYSETQKKAFLGYLREHPRVTTLISLMGDFDFTCVIAAKDTMELEQISSQIRQKFSHIIADWKGVLVLKTYKFEEYDLLADIED